MKLISVLHNGKIHRLSELALEILGLERVEHKEKPIEIKKLPPNRKKNNSTQIPGLGKEKAA